MLSEILFSFFDQNSIVFISVNRTRHNNTFENDLLFDIDNVAQMNREGKPNFSSSASRKEPGKLVAVSNELAARIKSLVAVRIINSDELPITFF